MRIAMISTPFVAVPPKDYGGTELVVAQLTDGLVSRGHEVTLYATGDSTTTAELRWLFASAQWPPDALTDINHITWAMREAQAGGYDLVHAHSAAALAIHRWMPELPLVYTLHHAREAALSAFYAHFAHAAYVAISRDQARRETRLPDVTVIHHGLDPRGYTWTASPSDYVAFVGRFAPVKGAHTAIDVAERAGVPIRIAGAVHEVDGAFGDREIAPRLAKPHVYYLGKIGADLKRPLLRDARALLMPIEWAEPFGLIMIEAMLSGCPVVAFPNGSVPELVEDGVTGYVVDDADAMAAVVRPGGPLIAFDRGRCRARAIERFGVDRMVAAYEGLYERLAQRSGRTRLIA
jgi:glycosyltransferase involved in cell wall biosynthesis